MQNKEMIDKLRDNAELAWASYGYFHLANPNYDFNKNEIDKKRLEEFRKINNKVIFPTTSDILNIKYKYFRDKKTGKLKNGLLDDKLFDGDFSPTQAKRFFEKYDLLEHQRNTNSGFSATLFGEKRKQTNIESKEVSYTNDYGYTNYILSFRGTEVTIDVEKMLQDFYTDFLLAQNTIPQQYFDMIDFVETKVKPIIYNDTTQSYAKMTIAGHSLGGFLAQMFALSYSELVEEVYTYNAPGIFNDKTAKLIESIFVGITTFLALTHYGRIIIGTGIIGSSIYSLFQSKTNIAPNKMITINNNTNIYGGMIEINESLFRRIGSYQTNSKKLLAVSGNDNIAHQLRYTIPYFLRTDQEEITLQKARDNKGIREIYYQPSMQEEAQKLYDTIKAYRDTHKDQTFYVYYAYAFTHQATSIQISESSITILDYEIGIPYNNLLNQCKTLRKNNQYLDKTLDSRMITHSVSRNANGELDVIGSLGIKIPAQCHNIQVSGESLHSIIPLTQTLYFYSYLLELESNDTTIQRSITQRKIKKPTLQPTTNNATNNTHALDSTTSNTSTQNTHIDSTTSHKDTKHNANADSTTDTNTNTQTHDILADYLHELNVFMDNIRIAMNILVYEIDRENQEKYERFKKEKAWYEKTQKYDDIDFLALLISQINEIAYKLEALKEDSNTYFTPSIDKEHIIEALLEFIESNYFIQILDNELLRTMRNQCRANAKSSIQEKLSLATCQPFSVVSGNETSYINDSNYHEIYGYKGLGDLLSQEWHEEFINGKYKIAKGLYCNGNTYSSFTKYMIHNAKEKEVIC